MTKRRQEQIAKDHLVPTVLKDPDIHMIKKDSKYIVELFHDEKGNIELDKNTGTLEIGRIRPKYLTLPEYRIRWDYKEEFNQENINSGTLDIDRFDYNPYTKEYVSEPSNNFKGHHSSKISNHKFLIDIEDEHCNIKFLFKYSNGSYLFVIEETIIAKDYVSINKF